MKAFRDLGIGALGAASAALTALAFAPAAEAAVSDSQIRRVYVRLTGEPPSAAEFQQARQLVDGGGALTQVALQAMNGAGFTQTLIHMATTLSNRQQLYWQPIIGGRFGALNAFTASFAGVVLENRDARDLLTANLHYRPRAGAFPNDQLVIPASTGQGAVTVNMVDPNTIYRNNRAYEAIEINNVDIGPGNFSNVFSDQGQQVYTAVNAATPTPATDPAGLLTIHTYAMEHLVAGTNRRAWEFAVSNFMCRDFREIADGGALSMVRIPYAAGVSTDFVRKDVDRRNADFQSACITCHGNMDPLANAFSLYSFIPDNAADPRVGRVVYTNTQVGGATSMLGLDKINRGNQNLADGASVAPNVTSDAWTNFYPVGKNRRLGWRDDNGGAISSAVAGTGVNGMAEMVANSEAFSTCMVKRVFAEVCKREMIEAEATLLAQLTNTFEKVDGRRMKNLFARVAALAQCTGDPQ
jgi:hypothetical protein